MVTKQRKNKRAVLKNFDDILEKGKENEPYSSILRILLLAPSIDKNFELMKTQELNELIVKRYEISPKRRDKKRYRLFLKLKKELRKNRDIHLNQDIGPDNSIPGNTSSDYHRFESKLKALENKGFIERPKRGYCKISDKYVSNPLKNWVNNFISECKLENSATWRNSYLFFPKIDINEFNDDEIIELKCLLHKSIESYSNMISLLAKFGYRKANNLWREYLNDCNCSDFTKFRFWLHLIENTFLTSRQSLDFFKKSKSNSKSKYKDMFSRLEVLVLTEHYSWLDVYLEQGLKEWQEKIRKIFEIAFVNYIKRVKPKKEIPVIRKRYSKEYDENIDDCNNVSKGILKIIGNTGYSMLLFFPDSLVHQTFENLGFNKEHSVNLEKAIKYIYNRHPFRKKFFESSINEAEKIRSDFDLDFDNEAEEIFKNENIDDNEKVKQAFEYYHNEISKREKEDKNKDNRTVSFFKENNFFDDLEEQIIKLGFDNIEEFYSLFNYEPDLTPIPKVN